MSLLLYQASIPTFVRAFTNLSTILEKAADEPNAESFLTARLAPDMHPLINQIQLASDAAKGAAARLSGQTPPSMPDVEKTYQDLQARIAKTVEFLKSIDPAAFDGAEERGVTLKLRSFETRFTASDYLFNFALPNFFFHCTTAYAILRHSGLAIGKMDFLGKF
ncbi:DUF1993 family protein [Lacibacterium aquatile]|uniref:DUF1993 family protein n=1 Tax=Lacibacterium aquatile TaxID=1168082 RepID=A0ABW5E140_9PROT